VAAGKENVSFFGLFHGERWCFAVIDPILCKNHLNNQKNQIKKCTGRKGHGTL
jgi:hypothetical protein